MCKTRNLVHSPLFLQISLSFGEVSLDEACLVGSKAGSEPGGSEKVEEQVWHMKTTDGSTSTPFSSSVSSSSTALVAYDDSYAARWVVFEFGGKSKKKREKKVGLQPKAKTNTLHSRISNT